MKSYHFIVRDEPDEENQITSFKDLVNSKKENYNWRRS